MTTHRIVLVGFMGCGKTTVGRELARRLGYDFVDLDTFITENIGRAPAEIIREDGEPAFRSIETDALDHVLKKNGSGVIALGGGAWTIPANRTLVESQNCLSIWLDSPFELCWKRITSHKNVRPLAPNHKQAETLHQLRRTQYELATVHIEIQPSDSAETLAERILCQT
jgi:shikimate kinase